MYVCIYLYIFVLNLLKNKIILDKLQTQQKGVDVY